MSTRNSASSKSPPRSMMPPAVPRMGFASTTPTKPSPLRDTMVAGIDDLALEDDDQLTPRNKSQATGTTDPVAAGITTPPTSESRGPTVIDDANNKSETLASLLPSCDDDVFGPAGTATHSPTLSDATVTATTVHNAEIADRIRADLAVKAAIGYDGFNPRADRDRTPNAANAQGLFHPDALVFVANLSGQRTEDQLETSLQQAFDVYGQCHIKVKRDKNKYPFALVQFENVEAADDAIKRAHGMFIDGRQVRLEYAKAERALIVSKYSGNFVSEAEARGLLEKYGAIAAVYPTYAIQGRPAHFPHGVYVKFAFYDDCRDALRGFFNHSSDYRLQLASGVEPSMLPGSDGLPVYHADATPRAKADVKSVFVGDLPIGTTKATLIALFEEHGRIVDANVISKSTGNMVNSFGFIEYASSQEAEKAARAEKHLGGRKLRIEPKQSSIRRARRAASSPGTPTTHSGRKPAHYNNMQDGSRPFGQGQNWGYGNMGGFQAGIPGGQNVMGYNAGAGFNYNMSPYQTPPRYDRMIMPYEIFASPMGQNNFMGHYQAPTYYSPGYAVQMGSIAETLNEDHEGKGNGKGKGKAT